MVRIHRPGVVVVVCGKVVGGHERTNAKRRRSRLVPLVLPCTPPTAREPLPLPPRSYDFPTHALTEGPADAGELLVALLGQLARRGEDDDGGGAVYGAWMDGWMRSRGVCMCIFECEQGWDHPFF